MEELFKDGGAVLPVESGDGYKDYLVSQLALGLGVDIAFIRITESGEAVIFARTGIGYKCVGRYQPIRDCNEHMTGFTDLRIRYTFDGAAVWVQAFCSGSVEIDLLQ